MIAQLPPMDGIHGILLGKTYQKSYYFKLQIQLLRRDT